MARRKQPLSPPRRGMPDALAARLLRELGQAGPSGTLSAGDFAELYREAIGALEERVARGEGHPPMSQEEVNLLCRCVLSASTLAEAVKLAVQFCAMLHPRAGELALERRQNTVVFRMNSLRRRHSIAACLVDITGLYAYLLLFGWLIGEPLRPAEVFLSHPRREDAGPFLGLFEAPVVMGQKVLRVLLRCKAAGSTGDAAGAGLGCVSGAVSLRCDGGAGGYGVAAPTGECPFGGGTG
ncbi:AraC family transcriptional regulator ligand-binding domain-containing protein [Undibacterium arcticum]